MRKLEIIEQISLVGVIQHSADGGDFPYSDWTPPYRTADLSCIRCAMITRDDTGGIS